MKRLRSRVAIAAALTFPVYLLLANAKPINDWFVDGRGWRVFEPWFRIWNLIGVYGNVPILTTTMFLVSFVIAFAAVELSTRIVLRIRTHRA